VCDGFEGESLGAAPSKGWMATVDGTGAAVRVDSQHVFSGKHSVFVGNTSGAPNSFVQPRDFGVWQEEAMWGRMMIYFDKQPSGGGDLRHFAIVQASGKIDPAEGIGTGRNASMRLGGANSANIGWFNTYYATGGSAPLADCSQGYPLPIETGKWLCMEWQWDRKTHQWASWIDGASQQLLVYKATDGRGIALGGTVQEKKCWIVPKIDAVRLGWMQTRDPRDRSPCGSTMRPYRTSASVAGHRPPIRSSDGRTKTSVVQLSQRFFSSESSIASATAARGRPALSWISAV
jgi:hypothetical protein